MRGIVSEPLFTEVDGHRCFDFNKLIPMPASLNIECGSTTDENIIYFLTERCTIPIRKLSPDKKALLDVLVRNMIAGSRWPDEVFHRVMADAFEETEQKRQRRYNMGQTYVSNYQQYGAATWYDWCNQFWGTKWNASDTEIIDNDTIRFDTAWSNPEPILLKLAEIYPDRMIKHWWADEDRGCNTGYRWLQGDVSSEEPHHLDAEALMLYAKCWGRVK